MKWMKRIRFLLGPALICLVVCILLKTVLFLGYVPSASMEPTIASGSYILGTRLFGELERGDVVIFFQNGRCLVKRIAAVPGDSVAINDITKEAVVNGDLSDATRTLIVPEECYFMLGDNRNNSKDSRFWQNPYVEEDKILGKAVLRYFPGIKFLE